MRILLLYPIAMVLLSGSCNSTKETTANSSTTTPAVEQPATTTVPPSDQINEQGMETKQNSDPCRLIVSLISIGEGTDINARQKIENITGKWKQNKSIINMDIIPWGREGEADYCFRLNNLKPDEQKAFISEMRTSFEGNKLVQITENERSMHTK